MSTTSTRPLSVSRFAKTRRTQSLRALLTETHLHPDQFIQPLFISANLTEPKAIESLPGISQHPLATIGQEARRLYLAGVKHVILFGIPCHKDERGSDALSKDGIIFKAVSEIKAAAPELTVITDLCMCEYTSHGHCGILESNESPFINHNETKSLLGLQATLHAEAGCDMVAPSGMTDGMVGAIRDALDSCGHHHLPILSYAVKYASSFYGPFREAAEGAPSFGDRRSYQMNPANRMEAIKEAKADVAEGADILMVKPALHYLDIISQVKQALPEYPLFAYHVSGEFAMLESAISAGHVDREQGMLETHLSMARAGANAIVSYGSEWMVRYLNQAS